VAESCTFAGFAPGDQSGNFWIHPRMSTYVCPKVSGLIHNKIYNNKHSLRSNTKSYGGKTH